MPEHYQSLLPVNELRSDILEFKFPSDSVPTSYTLPGHKQFPIGSAGLFASKARLTSASVVELAETARGNVLRVDQSDPPSHSRLLIFAPVMDVIAKREYSAASVDIVVDLFNAGNVPVALNWASILVQDQDGGYRFYQKISDDVILSPGMNRQSWCVSILKEGVDGRPLSLALEIPARAHHLEVVSIRVKLLSLSSTRGGASIANSRSVQGWLSQNALPGKILLQQTGVALDVEEAVSTPRFWINLPPSTQPAEGAIVALVDNSGDVVALTTTPDGQDASRWATARETSSAATKTSVAESSGSISDTPAQLYAAKNHEEIFRLYHRVGLADEALPIDNLAVAQVLLYHSRVLLDINAAESAYAGLTRLVQADAFASIYEPVNQRRIRKLLARACVRSGRPDEARAHLNAARMQNPTDWECYFQLANLMGADERNKKRQYFRLAEALAAKLPPSHLMVILEDLIQQGEVEEALIRCLVVMKKMKPGDQPEMSLTLANLQLAQNDRSAWNAELARFFENMGVAAPIFDLSVDAEEDIFHTVGNGLSPDRVVIGDKLVNVIMTSFNAAETIEVAMRSVLNQTYRNLRLIVVDDCSSDETVGIARALAQADPRVVVVQSERNRGTYCAKNTALRDFPADYHAFHDSDDWMHPERIERHIALMESDSTVATSVSQWFRMDKRGYAIVRKAGGYLHENPASTFLRGDLIEAVGYFDSVRTGADSELVWRVRRMYGRNSVRHINLPLAIGLHHSASLTQSGASAFDEHRYSAVRMSYWESWVSWHRENIITGGSPLYMPFPNRDRAFSAPEEIRSD